MGKTDGRMVKQQIIHVRNSECVFHLANIGPEDLFIFGMQLVLIMCWVITQCLGFPASCLRLFFPPFLQVQLPVELYLNGISIIYNPGQQSRADRNLQYIYDLRVCALLP